MKHVNWEHGHHHYCPYTCAHVHYMYAHTLTYRLDAKLSLSTATPSIGGSAPTLETCKLTLIPNAHPHRGRSSSFRKKARHSYGFGEEAKTIEAPQAQVSEGLSSSLFDISTPATIPADNSGHKVWMRAGMVQP